MTNLIVYPRDVEIEAKNTANPPYIREKALDVLHEITNIRAADPRAIVMDRYSNLGMKMLEYRLKREDEIVVSGAHLGMCLPRIVLELSRKGFNVGLNPKGCI